MIVIALMTYALPWHQSTTELKGPRLIQFINNELATITIVDHQTMQITMVMPQAG